MAEGAKAESRKVLDSLSEGTSNDAGRYVALDCEFVGVGFSGTASSLARVSIVDFNGNILLDTFVRQKERVVDYRTWVSGIRPGDLKNAPAFEEVAIQVEEILRGRILVGHAVHNDLQVLLLSHPFAKKRDTALYKPLQLLAGTKRPALRNLAKLVLDVDFQTGEHSSVEDARVTMAIYRKHKDEWEASLKPGAQQKAASKPLESKFAIDPTRRFKHTRSLGLAQAAKAADLVPQAISEPDFVQDDEIAINVALEPASPSPPPTLSVESTRVKTKKSRQKQDARSEPANPRREKVKNRDLDWFAKSF